MKKNLSPHGLLLYPALLCIWLTISCAALFYADKDTAMAGTLILASVAVATLALLSGMLVFSVNFLTIVVYGVMIYLIYGIQPASILVFITFATAAIGTAFLTWKINKQFLSVNKQVERDRLLIEELRIRDQKTGLMRFHYARRTLSTEVSRSLRFGKKLSLILLKVDNWDELAEKLGLENRERLLIEISETLFNNCRNIDSIFINIDKIGIILPETTKSGAYVFASRLLDQVKKRYKQGLKIGIASFPDDAITDDELLFKCETALKFAVDNKCEVIISSDLSALENEIGPERVEASAEIPMGDLNLDFAEAVPRKKILSGETEIRIQGVSSLKDIDFLQKALGEIVGNSKVRLIDFVDRQVYFALEYDHSNLPELIITNLDIPNITVEEKSDHILIKLDETLQL